MASRRSNFTTLPYDATDESRQSRSNPASVSTTPFTPLSPQPSSSTARGSIEYSTIVAGPTGARVENGTSLPSSSHTESAQVTQGRGTPAKMQPVPGLVDEHGVPVTYTPITHRVSKAKKGKKVHICEYGCGKVR